MDTHVETMVKYINHLHFHPNDTSAREAFKRYQDSLKHTGDYSRVLAEVNKLKRDKHGGLIYRV